MPKKRPVLFAVHRTMPLSKIQQANAVIERAKRRKILARTAAARAEVDRMAAGADMTDVAHLPVITGLPVPKPKKNPRAKVQAPLGESAIADESFLKRMAKTPAKQRKGKLACSDSRDTVERLPAQLAVDARQDPRHAVRTAEQAQPAV